MNKEFLFGVLCLKYFFVLSCKKMQSYLPFFPLNLVDAAKFDTSDVAC